MFSNVHARIIILLQVILGTGADIINGNTEPEFSPLERYLRVNTSLSIQRIIRVENNYLCDHDYYFIQKTMPNLVFTEENMRYFINMLDNEYKKYPRSLKRAARGHQNMKTITKNSSERRLEKTKILNRYCEGILLFQKHFQQYLF